LYLMYVDESGDPGNNTAQSDYFCLTGMVIHESEWRNLIDASMRFRRTMKDVYGFPVRAEIHSVKLLRHSEFAIEKFKRLAILRNFLDELAKMNFLSLTNVVVDKRGKPDNYDVFSSARRTLFQRFENTLIHGNFPGGYKRAFGTVFTDATNGEKLTGLMRKMSVHNPIPNRWNEGYRNMPILRVIEDPSPRNSAHSLPIQACDVVAYFLHQSLKPNSYIRKSGAQKYFHRLDAILNKNASIAHPMGVVML
jgi:Protein of unknown function (DUF3800)